MTILSRALLPLLRRSRRLPPSAALSSAAKKMPPAPAAAPVRENAWEYAALLERKDRLKRPMVVLHQEKAENVVHLIGSVAEPIKIVKSKDDVFSAVSILAREASASTPKFWIPIVFQGDLAETAVCHLKENDIVYVTGKLCCDQSAPSATDIKSMHQFQVVIHDFKFVKDHIPVKTNHSMQEKVNKMNIVLDSEPVKIKMDQVTLGKDEKSLESARVENERSVSTVSKTGKNEKIVGTHSPESLGSAWVENVKSVSTGSKTGKNEKIVGTHSPESLGSARVENEKSVSTGSKTVKNEKIVGTHSPESLGSARVENEKSVSTGSKTVKNEKIVGTHSPARSRKPELSNESQWHKFVDHPEAWIDYRKEKLQGSVKPGHPDFKHKDTRESIWVDSLPEWVQRRINSLSFAVVANNTEKSTSPASRKTPSVELWRDLVGSPDQWVDNRTSKKKPNYPDFTNKVTGEALWLGRTTPSWVHTKIPALQIAKAVRA